MPNELDELTGPVNEAGRDTSVIEKQIAVKVGVGSLIFEIILWVLGIIPGLIFLFMKISASNYLRQLQQRIQQSASEIDSYQEQRVNILKNVVGLVSKAVDLDKDTMVSIAKYRSGVQVNSDEDRNSVAQELEGIQTRINVAFENYPDLQAHQAIADAMQQNSYLQKEITAARLAHNDNIARWNVDIQAWPTKMIVAAKSGYTTRIPFSVSKEIKQQSSATFF